MVNILEKTYIEEAVSSEITEDDLSNMIGVIARSLRRLKEEAGFW